MHFGFWKFYVDCVRDFYIGIKKTAVFYVPTVHPIFAADAATDSLIVWEMAYVVPMIRVQDYVIVDTGITSFFESQNTT